MPKLPTISVNIPVRTNESAKVVLKSLRKVAYPKKNIEIILIEGNHIARQRNEGISKSKGKIIYLLDNDSVVHKDSFKILAREFLNKKVAAVGGPSLTPRESGNYLNRVIGYALETFFGALRMRHKWSQESNTKNRKDYAFLGANLALRKEYVRKIGGFDEKIIPCEETELLRRLNKKGYQLKYMNTVYIYRYQRGTVQDLMKQFHHYGRGRMKQVLKFPLPEDVLFVFPVGFIIYSISLLFFHPLWYLFPLSCYFFLGFATSLKASIKYKKIDLLFSMTPIFLIIHLSYAVGLIHEFLDHVISLIQTGKNVTEIIHIRVKRVYL